MSNSFLLAVFVYWGWDCALSVNEETKDSARTPGRAAVMATLMLVAIFAVISVAALAYAGPAFLASHSTDVLGAMATSVLGSVPGKLLVLCVLTSTAASCQTTIMPTARAALATGTSRRGSPRPFGTKGALRRDLSTPRARGTRYGGPRAGSRAGPGWASRCRSATRRSPPAAPCRTSWPRYVSSSARAGPVVDVPDWIGWRAEPLRPRGASK